MQREAVREISRTASQFNMQYNRSEGLTVYTDPLRYKIESFTERFKQKSRHRGIARTVYQVESQAAGYPGQTSAPAPYDKIRQRTQCTE